MLKLACPHCQTVGVVPQMIISAGDWPIACHYCHQHYYAPVLSGPEGMERQIELSCSACSHHSRIDYHSFTEAAEQEYDLLCAKCHHPLSEGLTHITHILTEAISAEQLASASADMQKSQSRNDAVSGASGTSAAAQPSLSSEAVAGFGLVGFGFTLAAILAAQEGLIHREWLDTAFSAFEQIINQLKP